MLVEIRIIVNSKAVVVIYNWHADFLQMLWQEGQNLGGWRDELVNVMNASC